MWAAKWTETLVVVKKLMDIEADLESAGVTDKDVLSLSNPMLSNLQEVGWEGTRRDAIQHGRMLSVACLLKAWH